MFTITEETTPKGNYKIVILHANERKVIINRDKTRAITECDYYVKMITGITQYDQWLKSKR